jgi:hypothetical protein
VHALCLCAMRMRTGKHKCGCVIEETPFKH